MKYLVKLALLSHFLINPTAFAINNPVQGLYGGFLAGISHGPSHDQIAFRESIYRGPNLTTELTGPTFTGRLSYSNLGAGGGGVLGYKYQHFRLEGELLYNRFSTGPLLVDPGGCTIENRDILTPTGICANLTFVTDNPEPNQYDRFRAKMVGYSGSSAATYALVNLYYDFFTLDSYSNLIPYVGVGIGKVWIQNFNSFVNTNTTVFYSPLSTNGGSNVTMSTSAMQGILGVGYAMDDFTWAGMDLRYTATSSLPLLTNGVNNNRRYNLIALMFNINFAFDVLGINC